MYCTKCGQQFNENYPSCESCGQSKPKDSGNENIFPKISFFKALELCYRRTPDFKGRSRRSEFWWWILFTSILNILLSFLSGFLSIIGILISLLLLIPTISVTTRRLHDINLSGWWQAPIRSLGIIGFFSPLPALSSPGLLFFVLMSMILGCLGIFIYWTAKDGDKGPNNYGDSRKFPRSL